MNRYGRNGFLDSFLNVFGLVLLGAFIVAMVTGWVMNVMAVWNSTGLDGETIVRAIAIFIWPIGCIIGWFT
jgi:hypothetical protein